MSRRPENPLILSENPCFEGTDRGTPLIATLSRRPGVVAEPLEIGLDVQPPLEPLPALSLAKSNCYFMRNFTYYYENERT